MKPPKTNIQKSTLRLILTLGILSFIILSGFSIHLYNQFIAQYQINFQNPIHNFINITPRVQPLPQIIKTAKAQTILTNEQYTCNKFGKDCKLALAIQKAENSTGNCEAMNVNTNGSVDFGYFQINSIHLKKGWKIADLVDCQRNIDKAFEIYQAQGFSPWTTYKTKAYLKFFN